MNVLSLFDGISVARYALGDRVKCYYASEIEAKAIHVAKKNFPDTIHLGDVCTIKADDLPKIDLLIGGSPCTDLSIAKKERKGLDGDHSKLFWEYVRILREVKPTYFVLENVASMSKGAKQTITEELGVEPVMIDASLVSAQSRKRLFWTNIPVGGLPADRGILMKDILQPDAEVDDRMAKNGKAYCLTSTYSKVSPSTSQVKNSIERKQRTMVKIGRDVGRRINADGHRADDDTTIPYERRIELRNDDKSGTLTSVMKDNIVVELEQNKIRKLTPIECERLQSLPDNYTEGIANTHRYKCLGNAFNAEVIRFILDFIPIETDRIMSA